MDYTNYLVPGLLFAVVFAPLLGAVLSLVSRGRMAVPFAALHLGLTAALTMLTFGTLTDRGSNDTGTGPTSTANSAFIPLGVPGDPGFNTPGGQATNATAWSLLSFGPSGAKSPPPDIQLFLGIDGLNLWLVVLACIMTFVALLISQGQVKEDFGTYAAWLFVLQTAVLGAFTAFDAMLFYVFFELTLIPSFFLIGRWGTGRGKREAARLFFLYTLLGSLFTLVGLIGIVLTNPTPLNPASTNQSTMYQVNLSATGEVVLPKAGAITFSIPHLMKNVSTWSWAATLKVEAAAKQVTAAEAKAVDMKLTAKSALPANAAVAAQESAKLEAAAATARETHRNAKVELDRRTWIQTLFFVALVAGFAVKIPIVPFHTWLPTTYSEAPIPVTMLFAAVLSKLGTFGILRLVLPLSPDAVVAYGVPVFCVLGAVGIIYGAFCAFAQRDVKLLTAYSSVSHLGFLVMALFIANMESLTGAVLHMVNHGLSTGAMFALLGFLFVRYRTLDASQYGGLMGKFPGFAFLFIVVCLASVGLPGLNNFVSEMLMLAGFFDPAASKVVGFGLAVAAASGIFLSAWYTFTMVRKLFFGPELLPTPADGAPVSTVMTGAERMGFLIPVVLCLALGLFPQPILNTIRGDVETLVQHTNMARIRAGMTPSGPSVEMPDPATAPRVPGAMPGAGRRQADQ